MHPNKNDQVAASGPLRLSNEGQLMPIDPREKETLLRESGEGHPPQLNKGRDLNNEAVQLW